MTSLKLVPEGGETGQQDAEVTRLYVEEVREGEREEPKLR